MLLLSLVMSIVLFVLYFFNSISSIGPMYIVMHKINISFFPAFFIGGVSSAIMFLLLLIIYFVLCKNSGNIKLANTFTAIVIAVFICFNFINVYTEFSSFTESDYPEFADEDNEVPDEAHMKYLPFYQYFSKDENDYFLDYSLGREKTKGQTILCPNKNYNYKIIRGKDNTAIYMSTDDFIFIFNYTDSLKLLNLKDDEIKKTAFEQFEIISGD